MDQREDHDEFLPAEEERFRRDLQLALELSLQEQSIYYINNEMDWDVNGNVEVDVSLPVALPKGHPVVAEIHADVEREEVADLGQTLARASIDDGVDNKKEVLERLSQASKWTEHVLSERSRGAEKAMPHSDYGDLDNIPTRDVDNNPLPCRDVDNNPILNGDKIPRHPVGQGALKKMPRKKSSSQHSESSDEVASPSQRYSETDSKQLPRRVTRLPSSPAAKALMRPEPEGRDQQLQQQPPPLPQREKEESGRSTSPTDTEEFLVELEIARQNSLLENWAPTIDYDAELQTADLTLTGVTIGAERDFPEIYPDILPEPPIKPVWRKQPPPKVDIDALASTTAGCEVADNKSAGDVYDWLSNAQRHDPQLVKIGRAIKKYLVKTGKPDVNLPCKYCPDKCECIYVTDEYLENYGMTEAVVNSCDVEVLSGGSDLDLLSSGEHKLGSPQGVASMKKEATKTTEELKKSPGDVSAQGYLEVQRSSYEDPATQNYVAPDLDAAAFVEQWYNRALEGHTSGSDFEVKKNAVDGVCAEVPTDMQMAIGSGEDSGNLTAESQESNGWTSRKKYGNEKRGLASTLSWNTATSVWSPVAEDSLILAPTSRRPRSTLRLNKLPSVNYYPPEDESSSSQSNHVSDDTTSDTGESDSEAARDRCPDVENKEKF